MKRSICHALFYMVLALPSYSQSKSYVTSGAEFIFSFADIEQTGGGGYPILRFAPVVNLQSMLNRDLGERVGVFTGLAIRNVGYRMEEYLDPAVNLRYRKAFRSYNLGVPIGIKIGRMDKLFFYGGYEIELGVLYKEKKYENGDKIDKITGWFSNRENLWQSSLMAGIQFPYALNLKFKYYLTEFHNRNYTDASGIKPYANLKANVYYISLSFFLFRNASMYYTKQ